MLRDTEHPRSVRQTQWRRPRVLAALGLAATALTTAPAAAAATAAPAVQPAEAIVAWGTNPYGEFGNGTTSDSSKPVFASLPAGFRYTTVRTGMTSLALTTSGRVYGWGYNGYGVIGDGTTDQRLTPVRARTPGGVKVTALRGGELFALAVTSTGKVLAWGYNLWGQLGDGTTDSRLTPVRVKIPKGVTITAVSTGYNSALALTKSGRVLSWGFNNAGQLGDGTTKTRLVPGYVRLPPHTKITSIATGYKTGYAVTSTGRLLAWGINQAGDLGDGTTKTRKTPVQVRLPHGVKVTAATAGEAYTLALTTRGRVLAWGYNLWGQLGNGSTTDRKVPGWVKLQAGTTKIRALAAGNDYSMALTAGARILTWGHNNLGQLGDGSTTDSATPLRVHLPLGFTPKAIGAGLEAQTGLAIGYRTN
jgi:alpha-tubulin suppressor-like RCC1 family protein